MTLSSPYRSVVPTGLRVCFDILLLLVAAAGCWRLGVDSESPLSWFAPGLMAGALLGLALGLRWAQALAAITLLTGAALCLLAMVLQFLMVMFLVMGSSPKPVEKAVGDGGTYFLMALAAFAAGLTHLAATRRARNIPASGFPVVQAGVYRPGTYRTPCGDMSDGSTTTQYGPSD